MARAIQLRRGTASEWTSADPTLSSGEVGVETDTAKFKIGDGTTAWASLAYFSAPPAYAGVNVQTGTTYTFASEDDLKITTFTSSSSVTATIPPNSSVAFSIGSRIDLVQKGTGQVTVQGGSGVTVNSSGTLATRTQYSSISAVKIATDEWIVAGDLAVI